MLIYLNARSIVNKLPELQELVNRKKPDVVAITETYLHSDISNTVLGLTGYEVFRKDRSIGNDHRGGTLIAVKSTLNPVLEVHNSDNEVVVVDLTIGSYSVKLLSVYRSPLQTVAENTSLIEFIDSKISNHNRVIVVGDFNYPHIKWEDYSSNVSIEKDFLCFIAQNCLTQHVSSSTRETNLLDLCLTNDSELVQNLTVCETFSTSDHNYFSVLLKCSAKKRPLYELKPDFHNANWEMIRSFLASLDMRALMSSSDINENWTSFKGIVQKSMDLYVPRQWINVHKPKNPWFNRNIQRLINVKKRKWKTYKTNRSAHNKSVYNCSAKKVKAAIEKAKAAHEQKLFRNRKKCQRSFFKYVDRCTKGKETVQTLLVQGDKIYRDEEKAEVLSSQYQSVFTVDDGSEPHCDELMPPNSFSSVSVSDNDVLNAIKDMNPNSAPGDDDMYAKYILELRCFLVEPLKLLFRQSLSTGKIPEDWKKGLIVPIYKKNGKPENPSSYRPICLTSIVCKLLEKIVCKHMVNYLLQNNLISENQHGFMKGKSTATNLVETLNEWTAMLDRRTPIDSIYIDLAKAFDSVSHPKLLHKLRKIGFGGEVLSWLQSFLTGRQQSVIVGNSRSTPQPVVSGIPQGTILGPLLFNIYIDELSQKVSFSSVKLFADDTKIYRKVENSDDCSLLQEDLNRLGSFFSNWQLKVNAEKCEVLHLGYNNSKYIYSVNGAQIPAKEYCKDLGVYINDNLTFAKHIDTITRNAYYRIRQFNLCFASRDRDFKLFMYKTYLRPLLEYNPQVWSPYYLQDIDKVEKVQRRFTKFLPGLHDVGYPQRLEALQIPSLEERRIFHDLLLLYKLVRTALNVETDLFTFANNNLRGHSLKLRVTHSNLNCRKYFFVNRTIQIWNKLDANVVEAESINVFKNRLSSVNLRVYCRGRTLMA